MKQKSWLLLLVSFVFSSCLLAQEFEFGIKAGGELGKYKGVSFANGYAYGYHAGVYAQIPLNKHWSIQPELYYTSATANKADSADAIITSLSLNAVKNIQFEYVNVPLLLSYKPGKNVLFLFGPKYSILSKSNLTVLGNARDAVKNGDLSAVAGLQVNFKKFRFYGRYEVGLTKLNDVVSKDKWTRESIHVGVALKLL